LAEVHAVRKAAEALGYSAYEITGAVGSSDRAYAYKRLKARRPTKPVCLVFQVATGSLAIDLSAAGEVIFYSLPDSFIDYWQAVSRVLGPKQTRAVRVRHLLATGTVDVTQLHGLRNKFDLHAELMENPHNFLRGIVRGRELSSI
jgi:SNF2 family DNA or RNA helicase